MGKLAPLIGLCICKTLGKRREPNFYISSFDTVSRMGIPARLLGVGQECPTYETRDTSY